MNLATLISLGAALLQLSFGTVFLLISRASGWERGRLFAVIAFSAAAYSMTNMLFTMPELPESTLRSLGPLNYLFGCIHCAAWLIYAFGVPERPWRGLSRRLKIIVAATVVFGVIAQLPGAINLPGELLVVEIPALGIVYHQTQHSLYGVLVGAWLVMILTMVFVAFVGNVRAGLDGARTQIAGFTVFFACAITEVLVTQGVITFIFPADIGFLAVVMVVLSETMRGVLSDARTLEAIGRDLAVQVAQRTRQLDVANEALTHAERLAAVGQLAAGVGHEINNPLTVVQVNLEQMREQARDNRQPDPALVGEALDGVHRIARVVADLRSYSLPEHGQRETVAVASVIESARKLASHRLRHVARVDEQLAPLAPVRVDAVRLSQVLVNLLVNAGQALEDARRDAPRILIRGRMDPSGSRAIIEVIDNGVGMPAAALARLGEPYFSNRRERGGTGLGLFVARNIVQSLDGRLEFESEPGRGTTARLILPTLGTVTPAPPPPPPPPSLEPAVVPSRAAHRALVIDDEPMIVRSIARQLAAGYEVTTCMQPAEALALLESDAVFDIVLCDLMMPGMSGAELHAAVARSRPDRLPRMLFMTGGAVTAHTQGFLADPAIRHVLKPFTRAQLVEAIDEVRDAADAADAAASRRIAV